MSHQPSTWPLFWETQHTLGALFLDPSTKYQKFVTNSIIRHGACRRTGDGLHWQRIARKKKFQTIYMNHWGWMDYPTLVLAPLCRPKVELVCNSHIGDYVTELFVHLKDFHLLLPHQTKPKASQPSQKCCRMKACAHDINITIINAIQDGRGKSIPWELFHNLKNMTTPLKLMTIPTIVGFLQNSHPLDSNTKPNSTWQWQQWRPSTTHNLQLSFLELLVVPSHELLFSFVNQFFLISMLTIFFVSTLHSL